ncbi:MAG: hypothetical protein FD544_000256 [Pelagibacterales bacterium]|nr:hypothetical protein [Pelagibacterales bacterium]|tara:strand:- start:436 stop:1305 length:870 start_codon:yes stop_codon:yes gene_type:complete
MSVYKKSTEQNMYAQEWHKIEKKKPSPSNYRKLISIDHKEFVDKILEQKPKFINSIVESIYNGDLYILKNAISKENIEKLIDEVYEFSHTRPSSFHKMLEGVPNFHRWIDEESAGKYSIRSVKHATYIFPWNKEMSKAKKIVMDATRPLKFLAGLSIYEFENNTPKDKIVERLQVVRYPPGGYIEPHADNNKNIRLVISGYLTKRGKGYQNGGFFLVDEKNGKLDMEKEIDAGDVGFFYPTLGHGLERIDPEEKAVYDSKKGRWWFGLDMVNSDVVDELKRNTSSPYNT